MLPLPGFNKYKQYLSLGAEIAVALSGPIFIGYWLDQKYNSSPWFLLAGMVTGIALLILMFIRVIKNTKANK
ncbi:MAG TPA: AtpZ/AtpI family protein [Balneolaceae bacterium]|nr:AtpZ/AtpI family protein [Balneolaceae bacterium]